MKVAVGGLGYVGLSNALLFAQDHEVVAYDLLRTKVDALHRKEPTVIDGDAAEFLRSQNLNLRATMDPHDAYAGADWVIIATPTDYDPRTNNFDTSSIEAVIKI